MLEINTHEKLVETILESGDGILQNLNWWDELKLLKRGEADE